MEALDLCFLIDSINNNEAVEKLLAAVRGGVTSVQLRNKSQDLNSVLNNAIKLINLLKPLQIPVIINDHVDIAKEVNAQGVHLGQKDTCPKEARKKLGKDKIIGLSVETLDELQKANQLDEINYIGASAVFASKSKTNCRTIWGIEGLTNIVNNSRHPVIGIGGIDATNAKEVIVTGASGIAVISAISDSLDSFSASKILVEEINNAKQNSRIGRKD